MVKSVSALADTVKVVGNSLDDQMLELNESREKVRSELGFQVHDRVIYVMGHWGEESLYRVMGNALIRACRVLSEQYKFIFDIHPNEYRVSGFGSTLQSLRGEGFIVRDPEGSWLPYMVACDACV